MKISISLIMNILKNKQNNEQDDSDEEDIFEVLPSVIHKEFPPRKSLENE